MLLKNRVAIITGGASGIGRGIGLKFAEEGCSVAIADIRIKEAEKTAGEISAKEYRHWVSSVTLPAAARCKTW